MGRERVHSIEWVAGAFVRSQVVFFGCRFFCSAAGLLVLPQVLYCNMLTKIPPF